MSRNAPKRVLISTQPMCQRTRRVSTGVIGLSTNLHGSAASCIPGTQHFGSLGRNALTGPGYRNFDFSVFKTTRFRESVQLQLRAEIFNLFNHPNFASPLLPGFAADASFNGIDPLTGRGIGFLPITVTPDVGIGNPFLGGGGPRNLQLAARLIF